MMESLSFPLHLGSSHRFPEASSKVNVGIPLACHAPTRAEVVDLPGNADPATPPYLCDPLICATPPHPLTCVILPRPPHV